MLDSYWKLTIKGGNMTKEYESLVKDLIAELLEYNFQQAIKSDPNIKKLQERILELSWKVNKIISYLDKEEKEIIEEYFDERYSLTSEYNYISYIRGFRDCMGLLKKLR